MTANLNRTVDCGKLPQSVKDMWNSCVIVIP